jgi:maltose alpha-D-glucosyltransferase/alpha-amylase
VAHLKARDGSRGLLYGAIWDGRFRDALLGLVARRRRVHGRSGDIVGSHSRAFRRIWGPSHPALDSTVGSAEQSNTSMVFGDRFILKLFRRVEPGVNPDIEISSYLTEAGFPYTPAFAGHIEYRPHDGGEIRQLAIVQALVKNEGDAWKLTLDSLSQFFEAAMARPEPEPLPADSHPLALMNQAMPPAAQELLGIYLEPSRLLGRRTAEMHLTLARATSPEFTPEPFTDHYRQGLYHGFTAEANRSIDLLKRQVRALPPDTAELAQAVLARANDIRARFQPLRGSRIPGVRIRHHGDYHLGQVLYTGKDFTIIDFEGEPARALSERRLKRSPLRDVAGMLRSFQYAAYAALFGQVAGVLPRPQTSPALEHWAAYWTAWISAAFLRGYFSTVASAPFVPQSPEQLRTLLDVYVMDKAIYEVRYELNNRPDWVRIPLIGILKLLG